MSVGIREEGWELKQLGGRPVRNRREIGDEVDRLWTPDAPRPSISPLTDPRMIPESRRSRGCMPTIRMSFAMTKRITLFLGILLSATPVFAEMVSPMEVARRLGMSDEAIERVKKGDVVVEELEASSDKDLSIALIARIDAPLQEIHEFLQSGRLLEISAVTMSAGQIDTTNFSMSGMELPDDLLQGLVEDPEGTFYMSEDELTLITRASKNGKAAVLEAYQGVLSARARDYWEKGVAGITPYAGKGRSPETDLEHAAEAVKKFMRNPAVLAELEAIPSKSPGKAEHQLYWAIQKGRDRAAPVLSHRILYAENEGEVSMERRFYSGYDYDALQIATGILPVADERCVAFYLNHTYTAQVAGFGGGAKRSIGRKLMQKELVEEMERAQAAIRNQ